MSRESYVRGFSKVANARGFNPQSLANYVYASEMCKAAGWLQDWLTKKYAKQSEDYRKSLGLRPFDRSNAMPTPGVYPAKRPDELTRIAQNYSDRYQRGSLAKPKVYSGGRLVAK